METIKRLTRLAYEYVSPDGSKGHASQDPLEILVQGQGLCTGIAWVCGFLLEKARYRVDYVTLWQGDPTIAGTLVVLTSAVPPQRVAMTHDVLAVWDKKGREVLVDPTANIIYPSSLPEILADPSLADVERVQNERYVRRGYESFTTSKFYSEICLYRRRSPIMDVGVMYPNEHFFRRIAEARGDAK